MSASDQLWFNDFYDYFGAVDRPYAWLPKCALDILFGEAYILGLFKHLIKEAF
jgi:hypothetical protein